MWSFNGESLVQRSVVKAYEVVAKGLYNPYTLNGNIVVNGVLASAHSEWILDEYTPKSLQKYLPALYQSIFGVVSRITLGLGGYQMADLLDLNSPQGSHAGYGNEFLATVVIAGLSLMFLTTKAVKRVF